MGGKSFLGCLFVIACLNVGWSSRLAAQTATTGELTGTVSDSTGALIPGVEITATNTETALERTVTTNENGFYRFALLPPGGYKVKFSLVGFKSVEAAGIRIAATESVVLNRSLEVGAQAEQERRFETRRRQVAATGPKELPLYPHLVPPERARRRAPRSCDCRAGQRTTSTGSFECVSTFWVSLPSTSAATPRRPCEAMTMRSHFFERAAPMMAFHG